MPNVARLATPFSVENRRVSDNEMVNIRGTLENGLGFIASVFERDTCKDGAGRRMLDLVEVNGFGRAKLRAHQFNGNLLYIGPNRYKPLPSC